MKLGRQSAKSSSRTMKFKQAIAGSLATYKRDPEPKSHPIEKKKKKEKGTP